MGLRFTLSPQEFEREVKKRINLIEKAIERRLKYVGEQATNFAREYGSYTDRTGNLRSSTGYVLYKNGRNISTGGFEQVEEGAEGPAKGKALANEIAVDKSVHGYVLVIVAGMNYAESVETKGYDVISGAELFTEREMRQAITKIKTNIRKIK